MRKSSVLHFSTWSLVTGIAHQVKEWKDDSTPSKLIIFVFRNTFSQLHIQSMGYEFKYNFYQTILKEAGHAI